MGTLRMCYEYFFRIFTKSLLLGMHISTVSILQNLFLDKLFFLNFYQFCPYYECIRTFHVTADADEEEVILHEKGTVESEYDDDFDDGGD
jgi:hypothetical protein